MIARFSWDPKEVLESGNGFVIIRLNFYSAFAQLLWIAVTKGHTLEDYQKSKRFKGKYLYVGQNGGISVES